MNSTKKENVKVVTDLVFVKIDICCFWELCSIDVISENGIVSFQLFGKKNITNISKIKTGYFECVTEKGIRK